MKSLAAAAALLVLAAAGIVVFWPAEIGPEPLAYGRDVCAKCHMHLSRAGFGGEMRDADGRLTKYDDVGCLLVAMWAEHREVLGAWVEDHGGAGLLPLLAATFVADAAETPMGYGVVAFASEADARAFVAAHGGRVATLEELLKDTVRFDRDGAHAEVR
jgi:hypothetical protein